METKVQKRSTKKSRLSVFSALLTLDCVCWGLVASGWLYPCNVRAGSWDLGLQWASLSWCMWLHGQWIPRLMVSGATMRALWSWCSRDSDTDYYYMQNFHRKKKKKKKKRCKCCHNFSPRTSGSTSYKTTPKTEIDYTHRVMLNSAHWSPVYTYLALTSPRDNQPFGYKALNTDRCFSSHFCTSVFVLLFPYFSIFHLSLSVYQSSCADTNHAPCAFILIFFCSPLL